MNYWVRHSHIIKCSCGEACKPLFAANNILLAVIHRAIPCGSKTDKRRTGLSTLPYLVLEHLAARQRLASAKRPWTLRRAPRRQSRRCRSERRWENYYLCSDNFAVHGAVIHVCSITVRTLFPLCLFICANFFTNMSCH
jgi:hypothetical protein